MDEQKHISFYIPSNLMREKYLYSVLLYPFWGVQKRGSMVFAERMFTQYSFNKDYYSISENPDSTDYVFMPYSYWFLKEHEPALIDEYVEIARKLGKPLLIDAVSDRFDKIPIPNSIVLRYSSYKKRVTKNDIIIPVYAEDLLLSHKDMEFTVKEKGEKPLVGFVGWASLPFFRYYRTYIKDLPFWFFSFFTQNFDMYRKGVVLRQKAIRVLKSSKHITPNLILRSSFSANRKTAEKDPEELRAEFIENILESDYTLCVRGDANQSTRFYEVLSLGRIPIFVDTDIPLPLSDIIDYKEFCIFVDYKDINKLDKIVADFHSKISPEEFKNMQTKARKAYETYLRIDKYTPFLMDILNKKLHDRK